MNTRTARQAANQGPGGGGGITSDMTLPEYRRYCNDHRTFLRDFDTVPKENPEFVLGLHGEEGVLE